jgi:hypothetical protein
MSVESFIAFCPGVNLLQPSFILHWRSDDKLDHFVPIKYFLDMSNICEVLMAK